MTGSKTFLVLGANGALGAAISNYLIRLGHDVHALVRTTNHNRISAIQSCPSIHIADVRDVTTLSGIMTRHSPHVVVNCAFPSGHFDNSGDILDKLQEINHATTALVKAMQNCRFAGDLVHLGSALSYGEGPSPKSVNLALNPVELRGACKATESIMLRHLVRVLPVRYTELRIFTSYGPYEQTGRLIPGLLRAALTGQTIRLTKTPRWRDWVYNEDIAEAILQVVSAPLPDSGAGCKGNSGVIYNICSGVLTSTHEMSRLAEEVVGRKLVSGYDYPAEERYGCPDSGVLPDVHPGLDWKPQFSLSAGLLKSWDWAQTAEGMQYLLGQAG